MRIAVLGGSGTLGRAVVAAAKAAGHDPGAISRSGAIRADVVTGEGLAAALANAEAVVDATNTLDTAALVAGTRNAVAATTGHFVGISIVGIDDAPFAYYRAKVEQEQLVAAHPRHTILRITQFHDLVARFARGKLGVAIAPRGARVQPIDIADVAPLVVEAAVARPRGRLPDIGGPLVEDMATLIRRYTRATGHRRVVVALPLPGALGRFLRAGRLCCPDRKIGKTTFDDWLLRAGRAT